MCLNVLSVTFSHYKQGYITVRKLHCISVLYSIITNYHKFRGLYSTDLLSYGSDTGLPRLKLRYWQGCIPFGRL